MGELWVRYRHHHRADRIVKHHTVETSVMGRGAVLWTAAWMVPAAVVQAITQDSSKLLTTFGGMTLSVVWALVLLAAVGLVWTSRFINDPTLRVPLEIAGIMLLALAFLSFATSLLAQLGWVGGLFVLSLCWTSSTNMLGRAALLTRQLFATWRLRKVAKDAR